MTKGPVHWERERCTGLLLFMIRKKNPQDDL